MSADVKKKKGPVYKALNKFFKLNARGTDIQTEVFAGILMFAEVVCMAAVSAQLLSANAGISDFSTVYFGIILMTILSTIITGLVCNAPLVQSVSMGAVVLIVSALNQGFTLGNVLLIALVSNIIYFIVMAVPPVRNFIFGAVPEGVKKALPAALGGYLLVYGLSQLNLLRQTTYNYVDVLEGKAAAGEALKYWGVNVLDLSLNNAADFGWYAHAAIVTAAVGVVLMIVLHALKRKHATVVSFGLSLLVFAALWAIRANFTDYYLYAFITPAYGGMYFYDGLTRIFGEFSYTMLFSAFRTGTDFASYSASLAEGASVIPGIVMSVLAFLVLGVSETGAAVSGTAYAAGTYNKEGRISFINRKKMGKAGEFLNVFSVTALCACAGCAVGAGPISARPESAVGGKEGGKTGLAALTAGLLFIISLFNLVFAGILQDGIAVMGVLLFTAVYLMTSLKNCDLTDITLAAGPVMTVAAAAVSQNLGMAVFCGIIADTLMKVCSGKAKEVHAGSWIFAVCGIAFLVLRLAGLI